MLVAIDVALAFNRIIIRHHITSGPAFQHQPTPSMYAYSIALPLLTAADPGSASKAGAGRGSMAEHTIRRLIHTHAHAIDIDAACCVRITLGGET